MRTIQVSTETFAALWKAQQPGETSEDTIIRRILKLPAIGVHNEAAPRDLITVEGFVDPRYNVVIPNGFKIFRNYKGTDYVAQALQGFWYYHKQSYPSLNELSRAIGIANENAWANWFYSDDSGRRRPLSHLRDPSRIIRRPKDGR